MVKNIFPLIIVGLFGFIAGFSLLHKGLPPTHDGEYHVVRFYEFYQTLQDGNWYPRWAADLNNGYGIPLFNYVYPLPNYIASFLHFLEFSFIDSFKLSMFLASILGAVFFYLWTKGFWGVWGGLVGSIFYTFSPYHFVDIYIRGSVGEVWALAFFPAFLWSITKFIKHRQKTFFSLSSLFLALIIFSHNILALMFLPLALSYALLYIFLTKEKKLFAICYLLFVILLGLGFSAIFWLPALLERQFVTGLQVFNVLSHFPEVYQLIIPSWGSGFSAGALRDQLSFQIGIANLAAVFMSVLVFLVYIKKNKKSLIILFFVAWFIVIFFLMLKVSKPVWEHISFMNYFQFPWRFLSIEILVASFLAGSIIYFWKSKLLAICLIFLSFILGTGYAKPSYYHYRDDNHYLTRSNFIDGTNSPGNLFNTIWFNKKLKKEKEKIKFAKGEGKVNTLLTKSTHYRFNVFVQRPSEMVVHTAYFPGWTVFIDGKEEDVRHNKDGIIAFSIPKGEHSIGIKLLNTNLQKLASFVTIIAVLYCIVMLGVSLRSALWKE